jgi:dihydrodipicolinate synthase/N-acetylneuraminate lyase
MGKEVQMEERRPPKGLIVDLITPLCDTGGIDKKSLNSLLRRALPHVDGVLLGSPRIGEGRALDFDCRVELLEHAMALIDGERAILFWISGESSEETKEILSALEDRVSTCAYKGLVFWLDSPLYYHSNRGLSAYYEKITSLARNPFVLYNDPGLIKILDKALKRANIRTNILKELGGMEGIKGLVSCGSLARANNYQRCLRNRSDFRLYDGGETRFLEHPSMSGVVSMGANVAPETWGIITRASLGMGKDDDPGRLFEMGTLLKDLLRIYQENPVGMIKKALYDLNVIDSPACTPKTEPFHGNVTPLVEFLSHHHLG